MEKLLPQIVTPPPGPKAQAIIDRDRANSSPSYIKVYPLVVERGEGPWIHDPDGNRYLDFMAGIAVNATGHSHPAVVEAIQTAAAKFQHICGTDFYYDSFSALCDRLAHIVPGMGKTRVFLSNSGSEAVDGALKLVRHHTKRPYVVAFKGAFHGRTMGAISLNASKSKYRAGFAPLMPAVFHAVYPPSAPHRGPDFDGASYAHQIDNDIFKRFVDPREVAAIFVEPILGEGGYVLPPREFLVALRELCDRYGILLVFDEIQSGIGRTGHMFAAQLFDVYPDVLLSAKGIASGMPIGAIIAKESVMTWPTGSHGSTFGGNPISCAAALATLDVIEPMLPAIRENGEYMIAALRRLATKFPVLADVRGAGFMIGAEFLVPGTKTAATQFVDDLEQLAFRKGLLLLSCGQSTIRFAPPLIVTPHEIDAGCAVLDACLTELCAKHGYPVH
jgi:4-aminobutyrate aminotransferase